MLEGFNKIIDGKKNLILGDTSFSQVALGITLDSFKPIENEIVRVIEINDTELISREVRIKIGKEIGKGEKRVCFELTIQGNNNHYVIKVSNEVIPMSFNDIVNDNLIMELASLYASEFNKLNPPKLVTINKPFIIVFIERTPILIGQGEPLIKGDFIKYNNNGEWINNDIKRNTPHAFRHFTLVRSNYTQIIVDIQGVDDVYTNLQVHSEFDNDIYTKGNLGNKGILDFNNEHKCNDVCKFLKINDQNSNRKEIIGNETLIQDEKVNSQDKKSNELLRVAIIQYNQNNISKAIETFKKSADLGNSNALCYLGIIYHNGKDSVSPDIKLAIEYYKKSAILDNSNALYNLGLTYHFGKDLIKSDIKLAIEYYKKSGELGNSNALFNLGIIYENGKYLVRPDIKLSIEYYKKSGELGHSNSLYNLGVIYHSGKDSIQSDIKLAIEYYKKSAELGNESALYNLGVIYHHGKDSIQSDIKLSIEYYKKSADLGNSKSVFNLAVIYEYGKDSIAPDIKLSNEYYKKFADLGTKANASSNVNKCTIQ